MNNKPNLLEIQNRIDEIQEYIDTELCKKCEEMKFKLVALKHILIQYEQSDPTEHQSY